MIYEFCIKAYAQKQELPVFFYIGKKLKVITPLLSIPSLTLKQMGKNILSVLEGLLQITS